MSYETGTATSHTDLFNKLTTFLTSVAGWTSMGTETFEGTSVQYVRAPGSGGGEEVYMAYRVYEDIPNDIYSIAFRGAAGYSAGSVYDDQPTVSTEVGTALWDQSMPYWFFANDRRLIIMAKVSTVYVGAYVGLLLPVGTPAEYPYPLYVSANWGDVTNSASLTAVDIRWSSEDNRHRAFFDPGANSTAATGGANAWLLTPGGGWIPVANLNNASTNYTTNVWPWNAVDEDIIIREGIGDVRPLFQSLVHSSNDGGNSYGFLEGVNWVPGFNGLSPEDTVTLGGDTYRVFNNIFRSNEGDFCAIKQE